MKPLNIQTTEKMEGRSKNEVWRKGRGVRIREDIDTNLGKSEAIEMMMNEVESSMGLDREATGYISRKSGKKLAAVHPGEKSGSGNESQESCGTEKECLNRLPNQTTGKGEKGEKDVFEFESLDEKSSSKANIVEEECDLFARGPRAVSTAAAKHDFILRNGEVKASESPAKERPRGVGMYLASRREERSLRDQKLKEALQPKATIVPVRGRGRGRPPGRVKVEVDTSRTKSIFIASQRAKRLKNLCNMLMPMMSLVWILK